MKLVEVVDLVPNVGIGAGLASLEPPEASREVTIAVTFTGGIADAGFQFGQTRCHARELCTLVAVKILSMSVSMCYYGS